jgi:tetratricopeptide (TPR) repeat protein
MKKLRIFAASPSDMATARARIEAVANMLKPLADHLGLVLDVIDWRNVVPDAGRPEQVILNQVKPREWDIFIGILWHRFGTPSGAKDSATRREYLSGTEEEFNVAYRLWKQYGKPRIMMYRCGRPIPPEILDPDQFKRVQKFLKQFDAIKGEHPGLYQSFETTEAFQEILLNNVQRLLIEYGEQKEGRPLDPFYTQSIVRETPDSLPRRATFFGRDREMSVVLKTISPQDRTWGVLVDGIGGIGKSALAIEAAYRCKEKGLFGAYIFVNAKRNILEPSGIRDLVPAARTLDEFLSETARSLGQTGIAQLENESKRRAVLEALRPAKALLVYDNLETLTKEEQEALADFLREIPQGCKAIITSRRRGGEGAVWLRLEKLDWEAARSIIESEMTRDPQLRAKLKHAGETRWQELYDETKGSPLALVHTLGLMRVRATLTFDGALATLRGNRDADLQRFIFQEAQRDLSANDQDALRALSFFVPSAGFEAWTEVTSLSRNALETTIDRLSALAVVDVLGGEERYALHPLTRNFVRDELLSNAKTAHETGNRFAKYWTAYGKRFGSYEGYDRLEAEWPNLEAAVEWLWLTAGLKGDELKDKEAARSLNELVDCLAQPLFVAGRWDASIQLNTWAYQAMRATKDWSAAGWRAHDLAWIFGVYGRNTLDQAKLWADRCVRAWSRSSNKLEQGEAMCIRGLVARQYKNYAVAKRSYQKALAIFRELENDEWIATTLSSLGGLERERERYDEAERYYRDALMLDMNGGTKEGVAARYANLGLLSLDRRRWSEARDWFEALLPIAIEVGRPDLIAHGQYGLARVHGALGHGDSALALAQDALTIYEQLQSSNLGKAREFVERLRLSHQSKR